MKIKDQNGSCLNIGQDKRGFIVLVYGNNFTRLTKKQIEELDLSLYLYSIPAFSSEQYNDAYWEGVWGLFERDTGICIDTSLCIRDLERSAQKFSEEDVKDGNASDLYEIRKVYQHEV